MLGLVAAATILVFTSILGAASLRLTTVTGFLLAVYVLAAAELIALTELLSLFDRVGNWGYFVGELGLLLLAMIVWRRRGRPRPSLSKVRFGAVRSHPTLAALSLAVAIAISYQAFLVVTTPPNTWDSLAYHLARAAEWYQRGAVDYYPTHSAAVNATQPNSEMLTLYTFVFLGRDTLAAAPQLLAELASLVAVYGVAIRLGFAPSASAFAALLTGTLSEVALQSVTTQNDLLTGSFLVVSFYFILARSTPELALAGLALGLAMGTKVTAGFGLPLLALALVLTYSRRDAVRMVALACAGFAFVGAYGYALNVVHTGRPLGDPHALGAIRQFDITFSGTASTALRLGYNFLDLSGYPVPQEVTRPIEETGELVFDLTGVPVNPASATVLEQPVPSPFYFKINTESDETLSYFGPLGALIILPLSFGFIVAVALGRAPPAFLVPAMAIPTFVVGVAITSRYNEFNGRYLVPAVLLAMPLVAWLYQHRNLAAAVACVGIVTVTLTHGGNDAKPTGVDERPPVWSMTRIESQSLNWPRVGRVIAAVQRNVPPGRRLGYVLNYNDWIYPFYGPDLRRRLVKLPRDELFAVAEREGLDAIVVTGTMPMPPRGWRAMTYPPEPQEHVTLRIRWSLFLRSRPRGDAALA